MNRTYWGKIWVERGRYLEDGGLGGGVGGVGGVVQGGDGFVGLQ